MDIISYSNIKLYFKNEKKIKISEAQIKNIINNQIKLSININNFLLNIHIKKTIFIFLYHEKVFINNLITKLCIHQLKDVDLYKMLNDRFYLKIGLFKIHKSFQI